MELDRSLALVGARLRKDFQGQINGLGLERDVDWHFAALVGRRRNVKSGSNDELNENSKH